MSQSFRQAIIHNSQTGRSLIDTKTVKQILSNKGVIRIPPYQRPYSWDQDNVRDLLNDLIKSHHENKEWFIGTLFTCQHEDEDTREPNFLEVLDGQQRITTIVMLLRAAYVAEYIVDLEFTSDAKKDEIEQGWAVTKKDIVDCLILEDRSNRQSITYKSKFNTDKSVKEEVSEWICSLRDISDKTSFENHKEITSTSRSLFSPTKINFNKNLQLIYREFETILKKIDGLGDLKNIIDHLLYEFFVIQIPLKENHDVLEIFESLNNRGKPLNLSDILRFKSISQSVKNALPHEPIEESWFQIFQYTQSLDFLFKDLNQFLQRYINAIGKEKNGYTQDEKRIKYFEERYNNLSKGVEEMRNTLEALLYLLDLTGSVGTYFRTVNDFNNKEGEKTYGLIKILKAVLTSSEQAQIAFIGAIHHWSEDGSFINQHKNTPEAQTLFWNGFFLEFIKYVISKDIMQGLQSNERRNIYIEESLKFHSRFNPNIYQALPKNEKLNSKKKIHLQNLILIKHNSSQYRKQCEVLLNYVQYMYDYTNIPRTTLEKKDLEHIVPNAWFRNEHWKSALNEKQLKDEIEKISNTEYKDSLKELYIEEELWNNSNSSVSFVQLLGNKIYIESRANRSFGNKFWSDIGSEKGKLSMYKAHFSNINKAHCVPIFKDITSYSNFSISDIIDRTITILEIIQDTHDLEYKSIS